MATANKAAGKAIRGTGAATGYGVYGDVSAAGYGVYGQAVGGQGVYGTDTTGSAVYGDATTTGTGVHAYANNAGAIALYEKAGFKAMMPREKVLEIGLKDILYKLDCDVSPADLPKGNLAQQYPRTALGLVIAVVSAGAYLYFRKK